MVRNRWWVVVATVLGLIVGAGPINVFAFGVFLKPITAELGVSRGLFSSALTLHATVAAIMCPIYGWLIDRWGGRRVMLPSLVLYVIGIALYTQLRADPFAITYLI